MGQLVGERWRETEKERERERGSETDVPKLYPTMNMNSLWYIMYKGASFRRKHGLDIF